MARQEIVVFSEDMERKLKENDYKDCWSTKNIYWHIARMMGEISELQDAISSGTRQDIIDEAADVANYAMFIADIVRRS